MVQEINVLFEVGSITTLRQKPVNAVTHDWTLFVRGYRGQDISIIVEKVVFHLHETFPKPVRVLKHPPYEVTECGYGSFETTIEVHFRNKSEPRKAEITFDLWLATGSYDPVTTQRSERMRFYDVTEEFASKLLKAGGFIPNTNQDPFWSKSLTQDGNKPSAHASSVKLEVAHYHKKSAPNALVASKPSSTAAVASKSDSAAIGSGRSGKPASLALASTGVLGKSACDSQPSAAKCVTPQTPDSFADLFSHPHVTVKNKEKKKSSTVTGNSYSNASSNSTPKELHGDQGDKDPAKQKRLLEASLFGEDDSPPAKKIKQDKEKHPKDVAKVKESRDDKPDKREEKSDKSKESKHSKSEKHKDKHEKKKDSRDDKHEKNRDYRDDKTNIKSEHKIHKKREEDNKSKYTSQIDSSSRNSSSKTLEISATSRHAESSKPITTSGLCLDQLSTNRHSSSDGKHHSKSHKDSHKSVNLSSKSACSSELDGSKVKVRKVVKSDAEEKVEICAKSLTTASHITTQDSLDFSETSDNEGTISESLTILAKSSSGRFNIDKLFGSDDSMDSIHCKPLYKEVSKTVVEDSSPGKHTLSHKSSHVSSKDKLKGTHSDHHKKSKVKSSEKSSAIKSDSKDKSSKSSFSEIKQESFKLEKKSEIDFAGALHGTSNKILASRSPIKVKSEMVNAAEVKEVMPKMTAVKDKPAKASDSDSSSSEESDNDASDESVIVDDVTFNVYNELSVIPNCEDPGLVDLNTSKAPNGECLSALLDLQLKLMTNLNDDQLEHLTCLIEETGQYKVSNDTFDFDLCLLDAHTVQKIRSFVEQSA